MPAVRPAAVLALATIAAACGGRSDAPRTVVVAAGRSATFPAGDVRAGDRVVCSRHGGGAVVPRPGHGVGASTGFELTVAANGTVRVTCPRADLIGNA